MNSVLSFLSFSTLVGLLVLGGQSAAVGAGKTSQRGDLAITRDLASGKVVITWSGRGVLKQGRHLQDRFKPVHRSAGGQNYYSTDATDEEAVFRFEAAGGPVVSVNVVGYVNLTLHPGLSLIANPLYFTNNALALWLPTAPEGAQVYKYTAGGGFEVSTFDATAGGWSNPQLQVPLGEGFYFNNPSSEAFTYLFVGEVLQGTLVNPLPAGISTKGALVPQAGSINALHHIPGQPGDELRTYMADPQLGGIETISIYDGTANAWVPDLELRVGSGFWIKKQNPQDWVRVFFVN